MKTTSKITVNAETINHIGTLLKFSIEKLENEFECYYWLTHEDVDEMKKLQKFFDDSYVGIQNEFLEIKIKGNDPF